MKKTILALTLLVAPLVGFSQAQLVINGTSAVTIVENGGTSVKPIYIELANPAATAIKTIGTNGWIISENEFNMIKWDVGATGSGKYVVPFGYGTGYYLPLSMNINAGTGAGSLLFATYHTIADQYIGVTSSTGDPSDVTNMGPAIGPASPGPIDNSWNAVDRFWIIDPLKFPFTTKPTFSNANGVDGIQFSYMTAAAANPEYALPNTAGTEHLLIAQRFNETVGMGWGDWFGPGGTDAIVGNIGTVSSGPIIGTNFWRSWTLSNQDDPLPIVLSSFTAQCDNGAALIQWTSQTELDNKYYTIEKSSDGVHWQIAGIVNAQGTGNSSLPEYYSFTDDSPFGGTSYYLIYQTDFDGTQSAALSSLEFNGCETAPTTTINAYNTTNFIVVNINSIGADDYNVSLINMLGQTIFSQPHAVALGNNEIHLNNNVAPGVYILNIRNSSTNFAQKMVIGVR